MAKENETIAEIIAEMLGVRTEFPFVYLMGEPDTPEVVDFTTKEIIEPRKINIRRVTVKELADRLDVARKREIGGLKKQLGNAAKLREACIYALAELEHFQKCHDARLHFCDIVHVGNAKHALKTALAAPPRNCDVGVPEERIQRWSKFCKARSKKLPPIHGFEWEDYPYESEAQA